MTEGTALYTMEVLRRHGLNYPGDYEFAVVGVHPGSMEGAARRERSTLAVQLIPLNFRLPRMQVTSNLGEVSDYIPEIVFTAVVVDDATAKKRRATTWWRFWAR